MPTTAEATAYLQARGILFLPGKASNAGGVATSALEMSQNSERLHWSFEQVDAQLKKIMIELYHHIEDAARAVELELTDEEIAYLEEPYVPHPLAGVMAQNKRENAREKHVWTTGSQKIIKNNRKEQGS